MAKIIRKTHKKLNKKINKKSKSSRRNFSKIMKGGDDGRYVLPAAYFGGKPTGYFQDGSPELSTSATQRAVSQGVTWGNGKYAGPNLYPSMTGGGCGCSDKRNKVKSRKSKQGSKHKKSKGKGNKKH